MEYKLLNTALTEITNFIKSLENSEEFTGILESEIFFSQGSEGTLFLKRDDAIQYRKCIKLLVDSIKDDSISQKALETLFQNSIFYVLDTHENRREKTFLERLEIAVGNLKTTITSNPIKFEVYYPVSGLESDGLPSQVGNVKFCQFNDEHLKKFLFLSDVSTDKNDHRISLSKTIKESEVFENTVGLIEVQAFDITAAKLLAKKELSLTVDVINFFSDLMPYQIGYVYIPGEANRLTINIPVIIKTEVPTYSFGWESVGPTMPLSLKQLNKNNIDHNWGFNKICSLLAKKRSKFEDRMISAIQRAGKATIENRKEEAFLLYAISLESLILLDNEQGELQYRLSTRVAHLLGKNAEGRRNISSNIRNLYKIRSKIVHSGYYQVTDADLSLMRSYTNGSILLLLNDERFTSINNIETLVDWFEEKILS